MNDTIEQVAADFSLQLGDLTGEWPGFTPQSLANLDALFDSWRVLASAYEDSGAPRANTCLSSSPFTGFTRWASKPALNVRWRSSSWP